MTPTTSEQNFPLSRNMSLDSLTRQIVQVLQNYRVVRLVIEKQTLQIHHIGERRTIDSATESIYNELDMSKLEWSGNLLSTMLAATLEYNGYVVRAIFSPKPAQYIQRLAGVDVAKETLDHILGAEIVVDNSLKDWQIVLGMAPTYSASLGQLHKLLLIELEDDASGNTSEN